MNEGKSRRLVSPELCVLTALCAAAGGGCRHCSIQNGVCALWCGVGARGGCGGGRASLI